MLKLENMRPGEKVVTVIKRHWIIYVFLFIYFLTGIAISVGLYFIFGGAVINNLINIVFWMFYSIFLYIAWLNHELDMYVVTDNRVIGIDQISFLNRTVSECNLAQVQEVNSKTSGLLANLLNYGTLSIQTAGSVTTLKMDFCPDSIQESRKLLNVVDNYRDNKNLTKDEII